MDTSDIRKKENGPNQCFQTAVQWKMLNNFNFDRRKERMKNPFTKHPEPQPKSEDSF